MESHELFLQRCNAFFVDIVSVFCFGEDIAKLDPEVFEMLMRYAMGEELTETKAFSPFPSFGVDTSPILRSFLLQHLINSRRVSISLHKSTFVA